MCWRSRAAFSLETARTMPYPAFVASCCTASMTAEKNVCAIFGTTTPSVCDRWEESERASRLGVYPISAAVFLTSARVSFEMSEWSRRALETLTLVRPSRSAMSIRRTFLAIVVSSKWRGLGGKGILLYRLS